MNDKKVWMVTGCSHGLGRALVKELLQHGYPVVATSRRREALEDIFGAERETFLPVAMHVKDEKDVRAVIDKALSKFGCIDVIVNNAGFTHLATIEDMSDTDAREVLMSTCSGY